MKKGNLEKWSDIPHCTNLLLFSQLVNELLFDYSIPSNRISTLNSHYLCFDALNAINCIDKHGVPEGTLKPIMEELYYSLKKDPIFADDSPKPEDYFVKYTGEKYNLSKASDMGYQDLKKCALAINTRFFKGNQYFYSLREKITYIIKENDISLQKDLFRLVKAMLTELMNMGYSLRYVYEVMKRIFWRAGVNIDDPKVIEDFFKEFSLKNNEYEVVCKVDKRKLGRFVRQIEGLEFVDNIEARYGLHYEKQFLNHKNNEGFLITKLKCLDPFSAVEHFVEMLSDNFSLYRLYDHSFRYNVSSSDCGVYDKKQYYRVTKSVGPIEHTKAISTEQLTEGLSQFEQMSKSISSQKSLEDFLSILNAARFHSNSLISDSGENQLLDLWAIFESVLDISNAHTSDRINQVCMYLVPILKRGYIYSLFEQLANDIKNYSVDKYNSIIGSACTIDEVVEKVCKFCLLDDDARNTFLNDCNDFPLLKERIEYYNEVMSDTSSVYSFVEKHAERVKWQVMRIYRNRNLIIHNSKSMPYLPLLIENLHSYVDTFLSYSIDNLANGHDIESMCQDLFVKECEWNSIFQRKNRPIDEDLIKNMISL